MALKLLVVKEKVQGKELSITHIGTNSMIAYPLSKVLPPKRFLEHVARMAIVSAMDDI